ncbi:LexA family transcriptional regulator [Mesorhizobium sp. M8A.F.Ca.ET.165.01.1.1]|uniref:LexA family transcriptional regulator n=1 Tax=Mesorhizobium sp. M8A.F.Ca.ET.165.01.1.1 TaxID=2563960 RepID=UPI00109391F8|nr:LexA family transcriptional regulator [Mesorhizobium sp. M8A.F.Ca.ET.165.01.1.1]TGT36196.1 LexA family transcriptional regulator [Mesorhizobium sp. M8A.F.Ca.ET.165.01.1.1]
MHKEQTPADRLREARLNAGFKSATKAAEALKIPLGTYAGHENGSRTFDTEAAKLYSKAFNVRVAWLMFGEMPMYTYPESSDEVIREMVRVPLDQWDPAEPDHGSHIDSSQVGEDGGVLSGAHRYTPKMPGATPEIDVRPGAGHGQVGAEVVAISSAGTVTGHKVVSEWLIPDAFFRHELQASPAGSIFMAVVGDSMAPTLYPGNRIIVDTRQSNFGADGIYVFDDGDGEPRVKRLSKVLFSQPPAVTILSDNPAHPPQNALLEDVRIIGRVVGQVSRL